MKEWLEAAIFLKPECHIAQHILPIVIEKYLPENIDSFHYFHEPNYEIRLRVLADKRTCQRIKKILRKQIETLPWCQRIRFRKYRGEKKLYGKKGFDIAKDYFETGSITALRLLSLDRKKELEKSKDFHARRYTHLFLNQLGYSTWKELKWAVTYAWYRLKVWFLYNIVWRHKGR